MINNKTVLITGGSGFVGANLVRTLLKKNYTVHLILRKNSNSWRINDILSQLQIHIHDLSDLASLTKILKKIQPNFIFHLAAFGQYSAQTDLTKMVQTNIVNFKNILEASRKINYSCFIVTGSSSEYGFKKKPMKEIDILEPASFYAATKGSATLISEVFSKIYNKPIIVFRLFSVYGPYEDSSRFIPVAMKAAIKNQKLNLTPGKIRRDFIHIEDVVNAYLTVTKIPWEKFEVFNIGTGKQYTNQQIAKYIKKINKNKLDIQIGKFKPRAWDTDYWVADIKKSKKLLGWHAKISLEKGLGKTLHWFQENIELYK